MEASNLEGGERESIGESSFSSLYKRKENIKMNFVIIYEQGYQGYQTNTHRNYHLFRSVQVSVRGSGGLKCQGTMERIRIRAFRIGKTVGNFQISHNPKLMS